MNNRIVVWLAAVLLAVPLSAHDFWIEPSSFEPSVGSRVSIALLVGENLAGERVALRPDRVERFVAIEGAHERPIAGAVAIAKENLVRVVYRSRPTLLTLNAAKFEQYLREEGLERIIARRAARGQSAKPGRELFSRCAKSLLRPSGTSESDRASGLPLEIIAESQRSFVVVYRDEPLRDSLVVAIPASGAPAFRSRTDGDGRVTFPIREPGLWLVKTVHMVEAPPDSGADWESLWASLTFSNQSIAGDR